MLRRIRNLGVPRYKRLANDDLWSDHENPWCESSEASREDPENSRQSITDDLRSNHKRRHNRSCGKKQIWRRETMLKEKEGRSTNNNKNRDRSYTTLEETVSNSPNNNNNRGRCYTALVETVGSSSRKCSLDSLEDEDVWRYCVESVRPTFRRRRGGLSESLLRKDLEVFRVYFIDARLKDYNLI